MRGVVVISLLPGGDRFLLCRSIRQFSQVPIIILTARSQEQDRLHGFDLGADDYICKPFSPREMVSRIKAILKRTENVQPATTNVNSKLELDEATYCARLNGATLGLTAVEFRILTCLSQHPGRVFSRSELLDRVYPGYRIINDRTIDSHVKNLRRKLKSVAPGDDVVQSVYGAGYKLELNT
jgi:two-component system response regulator BaeR